MRNRTYLKAVCPSFEDWQALLSHALPTGRIADMETHLDGCARCEAIVNSLTPPLPKALRKAVGGLRPVSLEDPAFWRKWSDTALCEDLANDPRPAFERKGEYRSLVEIGRGGMGTVYRAWDIGLECEVAIKILSARFRRSANAVVRLKEEAQRQAKLKHENIVRVYASGERDGFPFFAMELVEGQTLAVEIKRTPPTPRRAAELVRSIAMAIHYAHTKHIFHLDLKPANILMTADGVPKVGDFGLSRSLDGPSALQRGKCAGTDEYMSPEQWVGEPESLREQTDVYGLGAILYQLVSDRPPFTRGAERAETRRQILFDPPPRPGRAGTRIPRDLETICLRCLQKRPEDRYASALEVATSLDRFLRGYPVEDCSWATHAAYLVRRRRVSTAVVLATVLCVATAVGLLVSARRRQQITDAQNQFAKGRQWIDEGRVTDGIDVMSRASELLPWGEKPWRGHFSRALATRKAGQNREIVGYTHTSEITAAALSPDGRSILFGDVTGATILWDMTHKSTRVLSRARPAQPVDAVAFNRRGTLCASGGHDCKATVYDTRTAQTIGTFNLDFYVRCLAFAGDEGWLVTGTGDPQGPLRRFNVNSLAPHRTSFNASGLPLRNVREIIVSPHGDRFLSISFPNRCVLWNARTCEQVADLADDPRHADGSGRVEAAFSVDGSRVVVAGAQLTLYDGQSGTLSKKIDAGVWKEVYDVAFRADGGLSLVLDTERATVIRRGGPDLRGWHDVATDRLNGPAELRMVPGTRLLLTGRDTKTIRLVESARLIVREADLGSDVGAAQVTTSADGLRIATLTRPKWSGTDGAARLTPTEMLRLYRSSVQIWDGRSLRALSDAVALPGGHVAQVIALSPTHDRIAVGCNALNGSDDLAPVLLGTLTRDGNVTFRQLGTHAADVMAMAFTADGSKLITGSTRLPGGMPAELVCWTLDGQRRHDWRVTSPVAVTALAVAPDGSFVAVGGTDGVLRCVALDQPNRAPKVLETGGDIAGLAFSRDGSLLAVAQPANRVRIFEATGSTFRLLAQLEHPRAYLSALAFSPGNDVLYVKGTDEIYRWDTEVWERLDPVISFVDGVMDFSLIANPPGVVAVTRNGRMVVQSIDAHE